MKVSQSPHKSLKQMKENKQAKLRFYWIWKNTVKDNLQSNSKSKLEVSQDTYKSKGTLHAE